MIDSKLKKGLGRGLSSLLGDNSQKIETNKIAIKDIVRNKFQPRKIFEKDTLEELTNSIRDFNFYVKNDKKSEQVILPLGDGFTVCRKL